MVDTPKESDGNEAMEDITHEKQSKHRRHKRRSKPRQSINSDTGTNNNPDGAEDENNPAQPGFEQAEREDGQAIPKEQAIDGESEEDNYMPLSEDDMSLGNKEFIVPGIPSSRSASSASL